MNLNNLTNLHIDVLKEVGNIGAGNATTSMAQLLNKQIHMEVPTVKIVSFDEMMDIAGGPEEVIVALFFELDGEFPGSVFFMLSIEEAENLIQHMTGQQSIDIQDEAQQPLALSALKEMSNIITGAYISALSDFMQINIRPSIPHLTIDMVGAILTVGLIELSQVSDYAIVIDTEINDQKTNGITSHFFLLPEPESLKKIFQALGIENDE